MPIISNCTALTIKNAALALKEGHLVAFPTETVYGLGADATNKDAVTKIYEAKGRPTGHPLIVHISSIEHLVNWASYIPDYAIKLARKFWPGPLTLILRRTSLAKDFITGSQDNVGLRVPSNVIALALLKEFEIQGGAGIAAPSANRFGAVSATTANAVELELGGHLSLSDQILDGGNCRFGIESTIIDCTQSNPSILRPGFITEYMIRTTLGNDVNLINSFNSNQQVKAPGLYRSHYSPKARVILIGQPQKGDGLIALNTTDTPQGVIRLASPSSTEEYAAILYEAFRKADALGIKKIFVKLHLEDGISFAINDRLLKASSEHAQ
jgi:L-threonylcarbamoyladenylate synthase